MIALNLDYTPVEYYPLPTSTVTSFVPQEKESVFSFEINQRAFRLLKEFKSLTDNWDDEQALAPNPKSIRSAENLVKKLSKSAILVYHTAPGPQGEVMVDLRENGKSLEIIFYSNRSILVKFPPNGIPTQEEFNDEKLPELMNWLNG